MGAPVAPLAQRHARADEGRRGRAARPGWFPQPRRLVEDPAPCRERGSRGTTSRGGRRDPPSSARIRVGPFPVGRGAGSAERSAGAHTRLTYGSWQRATPGPVRAFAHQPLGPRLREPRAAVARRASTCVSRSNSCDSETWSARATATSEESVGLLLPASRSCQCFADSSADSAAASCVNSRSARNSRIRSPIRFAVASTSRDARAVDRHAGRFARFGGLRGTSARLGPHRTCLHRTSPAAHTTLGPV